MAELAGDADRNADSMTQAEAARRAMGGIGMMLVALTIVPMMDAAAKYLSDDLATMQIVWARYFFHLLFLLPVILWRYGRRAFHTRRPAMQVVRGSLLATSTFLFFAAIAHMPLADAIATIFIYPFIVTALSPAVLGEPVGIRRWLAVFVGFAGALIVIRPTGAVMNEGVVLALGAGMGFAGYTLFTRKLAGIDPPLITLAFTGLVGAVGSSFFLPIVWIAPEPRHWPLLAFIGLCAAVGHFLIILAYERVRAATLAPLGYFEIVTATLLGFVIFGDFPDQVTWLGIAVIVASGIYISYRERVNNALSARTAPKQRL